jgi:isopentenyldiphosphate isomerase
MKATPPEELFPVVDEEGNQIGTAPRSVCHDGKSKLLHPVIHLHLFNRKGELFLQKRSEAKDLLPGYWDSSVGGHISPGENTEEALLRETVEELGLIDFSYEFIRKYIWESPRERELVYSFRGITDKTPVINPDEIEEGRFWNKQELVENLGRDIFTPNLEYELRMLIIID